MRIDLKCPAEMLGAELPTEESPFVRLTLMDLTDRGIASCEATVKLADREGRIKTRTVHRARGLGGRPHSVFLMMMNTSVNRNSMIQKCGGMPRKRWENTLVSVKPSTRSSAS